MALRFGTFPAGRLFRDINTLFGYFDQRVLWGQVVAISALQLAAAWTLLNFPFLHYWKLTLWGFVLYQLNCFGVTAGCHRLWSHRAYKATLPFRAFLMFCFALSGQGLLRIWVKGHVVHHKHTDTDADPYNSHRGLFFAHVGWLWLDSHPEFVKKLDKVDVSHLDEDPVVRFQDRYNYPLKLVCGLLFPVGIPVLWWGQDLFWSFMVTIVLRLCCAYHTTWSINSVAHKWGTRPYNRNKSAADNLATSLLVNGEGYHNYHHVFPWDYKTSEYGKLNITSCVLDVCARLGLVYDRKTASENLVKRMILSQGDGLQLSEVEYPHDKERSI